jgi:hypothetical protein
MALCRCWILQTHDAAWKIEVAIYMLVHVNNEGCQDRMHGDWKEDCYGLSEII